MYLKYVNWSFKKVSKNWQKCVFWHIFVKLLKSFSESFWPKMYQKTDKSWDSLLGVFCYFWHIFVTFLFIPYLIQTLKTIKNVSKLNFYFSKMYQKSEISLSFDIFMSYFWVLIADEPVQPLSTYNVCPQIYTVNNALDRLWIWSNKIFGRRPWVPCEEFWH